MHSSNLLAISPIDGRYANKVESLSQIASEYGLILHRVIVELEWLQHLAQIPAIKECPPLTDEATRHITAIIDNFSVDDAERVKQIEATTNHDVKAVEYYLQEKFDEHKALKPYKHFIHFACTSEDINNVAYAMILQTSLARVVFVQIHHVLSTLRPLAERYIKVPMLSRTHGQTASPTTMGKELANVMHRVLGQFKPLMALVCQAKMNGAVGNFNAHVVAYPKVDWPKESRKFIETLGLRYNPMTTQIEPHDYIADIFHSLIRINTILIDLCRDIWSYISIGYFKQKVVANEVGSSTMPHKVNPIDFENAEGNLGMANAVLSHMAEKLPISRWQRDLTDSTVLRNMGVGLAYASIAYQSIIKGLGKLELNDDIVSNDIEHCWEVLAEAVQTVMRCHGIEAPYEKLKAVTRGKKITRERLSAFISSLELPTEVKDQLLHLKPEQYIGLAIDLTMSEIKL